VRAVAVVSDMSLRYCYCACNTPANAYLVTIYSYYNYYDEGIAWLRIGGMRETRVLYGVDRLLLLLLDIYVFSLLARLQRRTRVFVHNTTAR
jgi:hypothetical protein